MLWPLWLAVVIGMLLWAGFAATDSGSDPVNACTYLSEGEVARALGVDRVVAEISPITEPANLCDYSVPGGQYDPELPEHVLGLLLDDVDYYLDLKLSPDEEELEIEGVARAIIGAEDRRLDLVVPDRQASLSLAPGVPAADRRRILVELGTPLIARWLHD